MSRDIQFIGSATGTLSADLSGIGIQAGDLIVVFTFRVSSTTPPNLGSGYTNIGTGSGFACSERTGYRIADGSETSTGTWSNANIMVVAVYRNHGGIGATSMFGASSTNIQYPALAMDVPDRASHVLVFGGNRNTFGDLETNPPTGTVNFAHDVSGGQVAGFRMLEPAGGWEATSTNIGGFGVGYRTRIVEIKAPLWPDRTFYIHPTSGNNANNGTSPSTPWASLDMTWSGLLPGDRLLLAGDTVFNGDMIWNTTSGTAAKPIVFGAYGLGGRPEIVSWEWTNAVYMENVSHVTVQDILVTASATNPVDDGILFWLTGTNQREGIKVINCEAKNYARRGIFVGANDGAKYDDVLIDRCLTHANGDMGIFVWAGDETQAVRHTNVTIIDCTSHSNPGLTTASNNSGSGICLSRTDGGVIRYCLAYDNGNSNNPNVDEAGVGIWTYGSNNVVIEHCESHSNKTNSARDGGGFDIDEACTNCVIQYCYSHDNDGPGFMLWQQPGGDGVWNNNTIRFCISEDDALSGTYGSLYVANHASSTMGTAFVHHNVFYNGNPGKWAFGMNEAPNSVLVRNNIFVVPSGNKIGFGVIGVQPQMRNNAYWTPGTWELDWGANTYTSLAAWRLDHGQETHNGLWDGNPLGFEVDPELVSVGTAGTIDDPRNLASITAYRIEETSPLLSAGLVFDPGVTEDFFGLPVSSSTANTLGIHNVEGTAPPIQQITLTGVATTTVFGSPSLTQSAPIQEITPAGFENVSGFGSPVLTQEIRIDGTASVNALGSVTLTQSVVLQGFANLAGFGSPALEVGVLPIEPIGFASGNAFGSYQLDQTLAPQSLTGIAGFGDVQLTQTLEMAGVSSGSATGSLTLNQILNLTGLGHANTFGNVRLNQSLNLTGLGSTGTLGEVLITQILTTEGIAPGSGLGEPRLDQAITLEGVVPANSFGSLTLEQTLGLTGVASTSVLGEILLSQILSLDGVASGTVLGDPQLNQNLEPSGLAASNGFGSVQLILSVTMEGLAGTVAMGAPRLNQEVRLDGFVSGSSGLGEIRIIESVTLEGIASTSALGEIWLGQELHPAGIESTTNVGYPVFSYVGDVVVALSGIAATNAFGSPALSQQLRPQSLISASVFGSLSLAPILEMQGFAGTQAFGSVSLVQTLKPDGFSNLSLFGVSQVSLGQVLVLTGFQNGSLFGTPALQTDQVLSLDSLINAPTFGSASLVQNLILHGFADPDGLGEPALFMGLLPQQIRLEGKLGRNGVGQPLLFPGLVLTGAQSVNQFGSPALERLPRLAQVPAHGLAYFGEDEIQALYLGENKVNRAYLGHLCIWPLGSLPFNFPSAKEQDQMSADQMRWGSTRPLTPEEQALVPEIPPHTTLAWWRADDFDAIDLHEGKVYEWRDSMYGQPMYQPDPDRRPEYSLTAFGGTPGVIFRSGFQQFLEMFTSPWPIGRNDIYVVAVVDQLAPPSNPAAQSIIAYGNTPLAQRKLQRRLVLGYNRCAIAFGNGFTEYWHMHQPNLYWGRNAALSWMGDVMASLGVNGVFAGILTQALRTENGRTRMGADAASFEAPGEFADIIVRDILFGASSAMTARHWEELQKWVLLRRQIQFYDDFVRIEEDLEAAHPWICEIGTPGILRVVNNKMVQEAAGPADSLYLSPDVQDPDQYVQIKILAPATVTASPIVALRIQDRENFACGMRAENGTIRLYTCSNGILQALGTPVAYGSGDLVRLDARGTEFRFYLNGEPMLGPITITQFATQTRAGVRAGLATVPFIDNYENAR